MKHGKPPPSPASGRTDSREARAIEKPVSSFESTQSMVSGAVCRDPASRHSDQDQHCTVPCEGEHIAQKILLNAAYDVKKKII